MSRSLAARVDAAIDHWPGVSDVVDEAESTVRTAYLLATAGGAIDAWADGEMSPEIAARLVAAAALRSIEYERPRQA